MTSKNCTICKETKLLAGFGKCKRNADGYMYECKSCRKIEHNIYYHTREGVITQIYSDQKKASIKRGQDQPAYSKAELSSWIFGQVNFYKLHSEWELSNYNRWLKPSCDRLDDYKPYTLDNLRLVTWGENLDKGHSDRKNGINNKCSNAIVQYSKSGVFITKYHSMREAERKTSVNIGNISRCCSGEYKQAGGYVWCLE